MHPQDKHVYTIGVVLINNNCVAVLVYVQPGHKVYADYNTPNDIVRQIRVECVSEGAL